MRLHWWFLVAIFVVGCGNSRPSTAVWPAHIVTLENFSDSEKKLVLGAVEDMNSRLGRTAVLPAAVGSGYAIHMRKVEPSADHVKRAGYAIVEEEQCTIEITSSILTAEKLDYAKPVIWHEIGHCAGEGHSPDPNAVMAKETKKLEAYSAVNLTNFFESLKQATGL